MDDGRKMKPLSIEELASLFGYLTRDEQGKMVLEAHEDDDSSEAHADGGVIGMEDS